MLNFKASNTKYSLDEYTRYSKHLVLPQIQLEGQERLKRAKVLFIGAGGLGCPGIIYLAAAGIGHIGIIDNDIIDLSNLQRQIIYTIHDIGYSKVEVAKKKILDLNPKCEVKVFKARLSHDNSLDIIKHYDIVIDGSDNFDTRYLLNDICLELNKIHIYGAIFQFEGQISVFNYQGGPNYRDFSKELATEKNAIDTCSNSGVLGLLPGIIGTLQATEAIKIILGYKSILSGYILTYSALNLSFNKFKVINTRFILSKGRPKGKYNYGKTNTNIKEINVIQLKKFLNCNNLKYILIDVRNREEYKKSHLIESLNIPLRQLKEIHCSNINLKDKICFVYCSLDSRSLFASQFLIAQKLNIIRVQGGLNAWKNIIGNFNWTV
uniref:Probable molybdopterin-synthase adenylyltransferase n=1 Tax=Pyropia pulchra TaxID=60925 RepID=A0A141SF20_9RHOD|nr:molybdopterin biosynthesis protein [Pyropia pulchra]AMK96888.1 molybdopterin biosynthesis protein [Pyropia pulchra]